MTLVDWFADANHSLYPPREALVADLPDAAPAHHPTPWSWRCSGNGKGWVVDKDNKQVVPLYLWDRTDICALEAKLSTINAT